MPYPLDDEDELDLTPDNSPLPVIPAAPQMPVAQQPMNPMVKDYLINKFDLGKYGDTQRQQLQDQSKLGIGDSLGAALISAGGGNGLDALKQKSNINRQALEDFDKNRANKIQDYQLGREATKNEREDKEWGDDRDPTSAASKVAQEAATKMGYKGDVSKITAEQFKRFSPAMEKIFQVEQARLTRQDARTKKGEDTYDKYVSGIEKNAESLRGDSAAQLSSTKLAAIASGRALLKEYAGREDEMPLDKLMLLAGDKYKAVTGQAPTHDEMERMIPSNAGTAWAKTKSWFTGKDEPANSGDWAKNSSSDFDALEGPARDILTNRQKQVTSNPRLKPADRERISHMAIPPEAEASLNQTAGGPSGKKIVKTQTNQKTGQKRIVYADGSTEVVDAVAGR